MRPKLDQNLTLNCSSVVSEMVLSFYKDKAVFEISKEIVMKKNSNLTIDIPKQGRCNLISNVNGVIKFDPKQLLKINSVTDKIAVASKKNLTFVWNTLIDHKMNGFLYI